MLQTGSSSRIRLRLARMVLAMLCLLLAASHANAAKVCHLVVIADTNDRTIGDSVSVDYNNVIGIFRENVARNQLRVYSLRGGDVRVTRILSTIQNANRQMDPQDTIIVYMAGHGAEDRREGHYFELSSGEKLRRNDVLRSMNRQPARLKVLITDTCSVFKQLQAYAAKAEPQATNTTSAAFVALCWKPAGEVDISACESGQASMGDNIRGGYFTSEFVDFLRTNSQREVSWGELFRAVKQDTSNLFRQENPNGVRGPDGRTQRTQTPTARIDMDSADPGTVVPGGPRFGVRVVNSAGRGVLVKEVVAGAPGTNIRISGLDHPVSLESGDRIVSINGRRIDTEADYARAVDNSPQAMDFEVVNKRDGRTYRASVRLSR